VKEILGAAADITGAELASLEEGSGKWGARFAGKVDAAVGAEEGAAMAGEAAAEPGAEEGAAGAGEAAAEPGVEESVARGAGEAAAEPGAEEGAAEGAGEAAAEPTVETAPEELLTTGTTGGWLSHAAETEQFEAALPIIGSPEGETNNFKSLYEVSARKIRDYSQHDL
jgi:hypothetical protein